MKAIRRGNIALRNGAGVEAEYAEALTIRTALLAQGKNEEAEARHRAAIASIRGCRQGTAISATCFSNRRNMARPSIGTQGTRAQSNYAEVHNKLGKALLALARTMKR